MLAHISILLPNQMCFKIFHFALLLLEFSGVKKKKLLNGLKSRLANCEIIFPITVLKLFLFLYNFNCSAQKCHSICGKF